MNIPFNKPFYPLKSAVNLLSLFFSKTISGNGKYTKLCHKFFEERYGFSKALFTTSCTDALEMTAILARIEPGDEVIMPSFTFVSTANAFLLRGARIVFADTQKDIPDIDPAEIERLITPKTRAIVVVHYSGIACDMDPVMETATRHGIPVIEDAAHSIDSYYKGRPLGSIGRFGTFSFHETKNIFCGEGGLLAINREEDKARAEIVWEKGTNRAAFYRGEIDKYGWVDIGSSFLPSDLLASFLYTQLRDLDRIQAERRSHWYRYHRLLERAEKAGHLKRPVVPDYATVNGNMYYIEVKSPEVRDELIGFLKSNGINAVFHYPPLHTSKFFSEKHDGRELPNTVHFSGCIVRLPFFLKLKRKEISYVVKMIESYFNQG
jgi:dTDP-4-amino-4,6-dideoxygalactose transaminase